MWRLVLRQIATLGEIESHWCVDDLWLANEALDLQDEADHKASQRVGGKKP